MRTQHKRARRLRRALTLGALALTGLSAVGVAPALADGVAGTEANQSQGTLMAQLAGPTTQASADALAQRTGTTVAAIHPEIGWVTLDYTGDRTTVHQAVLRDQDVKRIDFTRAGERFDLHVTPNDQIFTVGNVTIEGIAANGAWHLLKPNFPAAWDITRGSSGVRVAVIDSEFDTEHPDLKAKFASGLNLDSESAGYRTGNVRATDANSLHGSHVAGIIGAQTHNGIGTAGGCWDCVVIPYKINTSGIIGGGTSTDQKFISDFVEALDAASRSDAVVINMSLGTRVPHEPLRQAIANARAAGKILVASAGNSQLNFPGVANYPAAYPNVIAVAATRPDDTIAPFSTNGDFVDISAPGDWVVSTWDTRATANFGTGYHAISGTSMSSPLVASLVALMKTVRPDLNPDEVEALLKQSAVDLGAGGNDPVYGAGRINALAAVQAAQGYQRPAPPPPPPAPPAPPPAPPAATVKVLYSCKAGPTKVPVARAAFKKMKRNARLICTGRTRPAVAGLRLTVQRGKAKWARVATVKTNAKGRFVFRTTLKATGKLSYRFRFAGSATVRPITSPVVRVNVTRR